MVGREQGAGKRRGKKGRVGDRCNKLEKGREGTEWNRMERVKKRMGGGGLGAGQVE